MSFNKSELAIFMNSAEINEIIRRLARQIENDYQDREILLICPLRGSIHFVADLAREIKLPQQIDFVHLSSVEKGGAIKIIKDIGQNITGKHVLIVEEIIDTGRTLSFLKTRLLASSPASLKIVTLLDKPARRELPLRPDYTGKTIDDRYVIGYGMDSSEQGRNYPDIYSFKN